MSFLSARPPRTTLAALLLICLPLAAMAQNGTSVTPTSPATKDAKSVPMPPSPERQKADAQGQIALKLQQQGKTVEAIRAYQEYLRLAGPAKMSETTLLPAYKNMYELYRERNDVKGMESTLKHIVKTAPRDPDGWLKYALLYLVKKQFDEAKMSADRALQLKPTTEIASKAHFVLGGVAQAREQWPLAETEYAASVKLTPGSPLALFYLAQTLYREKKSAQALKTTEKALKIEPRLTLAWMLLASIKEQSKDLPGAIAAYNSALKVEPKNTKALFDRARLYQDMARVNEALSAYAAYLNVVPGDFGAHYNMGMLYFEIHNNIAARKQFAAAVELKPKDTRLLFQLAMSEREEGFGTTDPKQRGVLLNQAVTHFNQALAIDPKNVGVQNQLAGLYMRAFRFDEAMALYRKRQQDDPDNPEPYERMRDVYIATHRPDDAIAEWRKYRTRKPGDPISYDEVAQLLESGNKWKEAVEERILQIQRAPQDGFAKLTLARDYRQLKQPDYARTEYNLVLDMDVTAKDAADRERIYVAASRRNWRLKAWRGLSELASEDGKLEEAITYLKNVQEDERRQARIDQKPPESQTYLDIANLQERNKQPALARQELKALLEARPEDAKAFAALADFEERQGKIDDAVFYLNRAEERAPDPIEYGLRAAAVYQKHAMLDKANGQFTRLAGKFPQEPRLLTPMAELLGQSGDDARALNLYDMLLKTNPNNIQLLDKKAVVLTRLKRYAEARTVREKMVERSPDDYQGYANVAYLYAREGKLEGYRQWLTGRVEKDPASQPALSALVDAYEQQNMAEDGWKVARGIVQKHKADPDVEEAYISVLSQHKRIAEAIELRRQIVRRTPGDLDAQTKLADLLVSNGDTSEANKVFRELAERADIPLPTRLRARRTLAQRLAAQGSLEEAITQLQAIVKVEPQDLSATLTLGRLLSQTNRDDEAAALYADRAKQDKLPPVVRSHFLTLRGAVYEKQGHKPEAESQYKEALIVFPQSQEAVQALERLKK